MFSKIIALTGNAIGAVGSFTGGLMMATGINPGGIGNHIHKGANEFAHGMLQRAQEVAGVEHSASVAGEQDKHEQRCGEIMLAAAAEEARHADALRTLGMKS